MCRTPENKDGDRKMSVPGRESQSQIGADDTRICPIGVFLLFGLFPFSTRRCIFRTFFFNTCWNHMFFCLCPAHLGCAMGIKRPSLKLSRPNPHSLEFEGFARNSEGPHAAMPLWDALSYSEPLFLISAGSHLAGKVKRERCRKELAASELNWQAADIWKVIGVFPNG